MFVKTLVYHALGTLMPYPSEDPPRFLGRLLLIDRCSISGLRFFPLREGGIHSISGNRILCLAVEKLFINLGEAAYRVGDERAKSMPEIPWRRMTGLRNILAHGYEQVAPEVLFKTVTADLPALETALSQRVDAIGPA
ncbi:DUF86 domain-containing protein [Rhodoferax sediminis]|uniref:DUF86 domain-containing protein n=1 Tax=Rhodoferax sediminis TaxID=2509614 RepID=A0A515DGL6_9BURK|nr:DUF86 domain-containing protein [Rhodoferax sediminis]